MRKFVVFLFTSAMLIGAALPANAAVKIPKVTEVVTTVTKGTVLDPCRNGYVNLSFDDGPNANTPVLLKALKDNGLKATFFDTGNNMLAYPQYVKDAIAAGHQVGFHSINHDNLPAMGRDFWLNDINYGKWIFDTYFGFSPTVFRPPYGATNPELRADVNWIGMTEVIWTTDTNDWDGRSAKSIAAEAAKVKPGGFVLMHDSEWTHTVEALPTIAKDLKARGLCTGKIVSSTTPVNAWQGLDFYATVVPF